MRGEVTRPTKAAAGPHSAQADSVVFVGGDAEIEVERISGNPCGDFLRPLDGEAPRWVEKIFEEEGLDLRGGFETVGVEVDEGAGGN